MHILDANEIFGTTFYTYDRIMEEGGKNGPDAFALYVKLVKQSRIQQTNQTKSLNSFLKEGLGWGDDRLKKARQILKSLGLIDDIVIRDELGKINGHYVRVNFLINENKVRNACMTYNLSTEALNHDVDLPSCGKTDTNALSTQYKNAGSTKNKNISSSSPSTEGSDEGTTNSLNSRPEAEEYNAEFDIFWKTYPHSRKGKKQESKKYFLSQSDKDMVLDNAKIYKWEIQLGIENPQFVPACERWIRDFVPLNDVVRFQRLYNIICKHMGMDNKKERYPVLVNDFGKDTVNELVKQYNSSNKPVLHFN